MARPFEFDAEIERRVIRRDRRIRWSLVGFAIAALVATLLWGAFLLYL